MGGGQQVPTGTLRTVALAVAIGLLAPGVGAQEGLPTCRDVHVSHPVWSPNGERIAFLSDASGSYELYLYEVGSTLLTRLTTNSSFEGSVSWSPSSDEFVFWTALEGDDDFEGYRFDVSSGSVQRIIRQPENDFDLDWSPDGTRVAFQSERDGNREIYVLGLSTGVSRRLTENTFEDLTPDWSPDGQRLAFSSDRPGQRQIYVMSLRTGENVRVAVQPDGANYFPIWDPAGERLLVTSSADDEYSLHVVDLSYGTTRELARPVSSGPASWSLDGRRVAYSSAPSTGSEIQLLDVEGGATQSLITCEQVQAVLGR